MPFVSRTRAILRSAEFGFFGVIVETRVQTPRFCGAPWSAGVFVFSRLDVRPLRISWLTVGMAPDTVPLLQVGRWQKGSLRTKGRRGPSARAEPGKDGSRGWGPSNGRPAAKQVPAVQRFATRFPDSSADRRPRRLRIARRAGSGRLRIGVGSLQSTAGQRLDELRPSMTIACSSSPSGSSRVVAVVAPGRVRGRGSVERSVQRSPTASATRPSSRPRSSRTTSSTGRSTRRWRCPASMRRWS